MHPKYVKFKPIRIFKKTNEYKSQIRVMLFDDYKTKSNLLSQMNATI